MSDHFRWKRTPSEAIGRPLQRRAAAVEPALRALALTHAARAEAFMKAGAPWTDQTGYARGALFGRAEGLDIILGTANEEYGLFLELGTSRMAPRPIIQPALDMVASAYWDDAVRLTSSIMFGR